jgi:hypothetical protein
VTPPRVITAGGFAGAVGEAVEDLEDHHGDKPDRVDLGAADDGRAQGLKIAAPRREGGDDVLAQEPEDTQCRGVGIDGNGGENHAWHSMWQTIKAYSRKN